MPKKLLMGNEAFAHAALEAGVGVVAGYPGTPSSELIESISRRVKAGMAQGVYVEWSSNEKAALELAYGASLAGARALFTCKQVGLNVASDALLSLIYLGVKGGLVLFVADDPGPISSQTEQDTRTFAQFAKVPVFDPATPEQGAEMMKAAFELSEQFGTPVIVRPTTRINHASTFFEVPYETQAKDFLPGGFERDSQKWVIFPKLSNEAHGRILKTLKNVESEIAFSQQYASFNPILENASSETTEDDSPKIGIITGGVTTQYVREALEILARECHSNGVPMPRYRFMQVGTPYPFPARSAKRFLTGLEHVLVLEELDPVIEQALIQVAGNRFLAAHVHGKLTGEAPVKGENSTELMAQSIAKFFDEHSGKGAQHNLSAEDKLSNPSSQYINLINAVIGPKALLQYDSTLVSRPPVLCAGCPHRGSFYAAKTALSRMGLKREDAVFCGDIGCYTLGNAKPLDTVDTCLCMGAGITMAQGMSVVDPSKKYMAFVGDSTFFASALTGIANAVYNQHDITIGILDNSTTAMTGAQPHPGTGTALMADAEQPPHPIDIEAVLEGLGVKFIVYANPLDHSQAEEVTAMALQHKGPSAVIYRSPCVWLSSFDMPAEVDPAVCTGCKRCIVEIGCPAITFNPGARGPMSGTRGQAQIDNSQCNGCELCTQVCPFGAIGVPTALQLAARSEAPITVSNLSSQSSITVNVDTEGIGEDVPPAEDVLEPTSETSDESGAELQSGHNVDTPSENNAEVSSPAQTKHSSDTNTKTTSRNDFTRDFSKEPLRVYGGSLKVIIEVPDPPSQEEEENNND